MQWQDEGIVLSVRPHGETAVILDLLTRDHGRHAGLVFGGRSRKLRPVLQTGNHIDAEWSGRLSENLGTLKVELRRGFAAEAMADPLALAALMAIADLGRLLADRDPHPNLFEITLFMLGFLDDATVWPALYARWELALLDELGVGLDLEQCASTGATHDLIYVSPKSGRAVSAEAGEPFKDRLLPLPAFLRRRRPGLLNSEATRQAVLDALSMTGSFLASRVFRPREMPGSDARGYLIDQLTREARTGDDHAVAQLRTK
jgi:DNA repair protein RecO (recombination protein O)